VRGTACGRGKPFVISHTTAGDAWGAPGDQKANAVPQVGSESAVTLCAKSSVHSSGDRMPINCENMITGVASWIKEPWDPCYHSSAGASARA